MKKYKYLVTNGCSLTWGEGCKKEETYPYLLAKKLNLQLINLAIPGTGWYNLETSTTSFIHNNPDIIDECFFLLQNSTIDRGIDYNHLPLYYSKNRKKYNMDFVSMYEFSHFGKGDEIFIDVEQKKPVLYKREEIHFPAVKYEAYCHSDHSIFRNSEKWAKLKYFPRHRHYLNSEFKWKIGENNDKFPPYIHEQFEELTLHLAQRIKSFHLYLKSFNIDHVLIDGYFPLLSYKLNFFNYYSSFDELNMVNKFWSNEEYDDDEMVYDFQKIKCGYIIDTIQDEYKIDDLVLWSLFTFKDVDGEWSHDGVHAGKKGMELICNVLYQQLTKKNWF